MRQALNRAATGSRKVRPPPAYPRSLPRRHCHLLPEYCFAPPPHQSKIPCAGYAQTAGRLKTAAPIRVPATIDGDRLPDQPSDKHATQTVSMICGNACKLGKADFTRKRAAQADLLTPPCPGFHRCEWCADRSHLPLLHPNRPPLQERSAMDPSHRAAGKAASKYDVLSSQGVLLVALRQTAGRPTHTNWLKPH